MSHRNTLLQVAQAAGSHSATPSHQEQHLHSQKRERISRAAEVLHQQSPASSSAAATQLPKHQERQKPCLELRTDPGKFLCIYNKDWEFETPAACTTESTEHRKNYSSLPALQQPVLHPAQLPAQSSAGTNTQQLLLLSQ